ncbi:hypothetical protein SIO70_22525 [Chitinophaga sancti]|nr:hypothetical protein [Chitinophaga sancti]WPQ61138.1 hypothetical protein SIO70_22525 [Chitinophaga sancti]
MKTFKYFIIATLFIGTISLSSCLVERGPGYGPPHHHHYHGGGGYYRY